MANHVSLTVEHAGQCFAFELHRRKLLLGPSGKTDYYWMDGRQFRSQRTAANFRSCIDLWWAAVEAAGAADDPRNQINLVLAEAYSQVCTARSMQAIYLDAHLHQCADRSYEIRTQNDQRRMETERTYWLPDNEQERLREIAQSHDVARIRDELNRLFGGTLPPQAERPAFQEAARAWVGNGIEAFRTAGREGLHNYIERKLESWIRRLRRRAGQERVRLFLNMFSYECKVSFYLCYASAWVGLVPSLTSQHGLNEIGARFLNLWHHQNQSSETATGEPVRDVFCGQVLALHPLSAVVLTDPIHLTILGRWIGHRDYGRLQREQQVDTCPEYWAAVATILIAAHEYKASHDRWEANRGRTVITNSDIVSNQAHDTAAASPPLLFEDYASDAAIVCSNCAGPLRYESFRPPTDSSPDIEVSYRCQACNEQSLISVSYQALRNAGSADDDN